MATKKKILENRTHIKISQINVERMWKETYNDLTKQALNNVREYFLHNGIECDEVGDYTDEEYANGFSFYLNGQAQGDVLITLTEEQVRRGKGFGLSFTFDVRGALFNNYVILVQLIPYNFSPDVFVPFTRAKERLDYLVGEIDPSDVYDKIQEWFDEELG